MPEFAAIVAKNVVCVTNLTYAKALLLLQANGSSSDICFLGWKTSH